MTNTINCGQHLEDYVVEVLNGFRYSKVASNQFFDLKSRIKNPIYARQCYAGTSLYNRRWRVDLI